MLFKLLVTIFFEGMAMEETTKEAISPSRKLVRFIPLYEDVTPLNYATPFSSGIDLRAYIPESPGYILIEPLCRKLIKTGYRCELRPQCEGQIRSRSGLALKHGICVLNSPGTIDADFEFEIGVILYNSDPYIAYKVEHGERIAQFVLSHVVRDEYYMTENTNKRDGGFGSTGK